MPATRVDTGVDPARGLMAAGVFHVVVFFAMGTIDPPEPEPDVVQFEIAELPPPPKPKPVEAKPPEPKPPEPKPPEPPPEPDEPKPKLRPKTPPSQPKTPTPPTPTPTPTSSPGGAEPFDLPEDKTIGPVPTSSGGDPNGKPGGGTGGSGKGTGGGTGDGAGKPAGPVWSPKSDLYIKKQPLPVRIAELECPAVQDLGVSGTVVLLVQVRRDGSVKQARVTKGIGHGCDEIAKKALRGGKFTPAIDTDGKSADYELRYEYVFELEG